MSSSPHQVSHKQPVRSGLHELLCEQLRDLYDAGCQYRGHLDSVLHAVVSQELTELMEAISLDVDEGISRLAEACELMEVPPGGVPCQAMAGLVREGKELTADWADSATRDAALIANAQRVVHYEIAGFGTAAEFARCLKRNGVAAILKELLHRSVENDRRLNRVAMGGWFSEGINREAAAVAGE